MAVKGNGKACAPAQTTNTATEIDYNAAVREAKEIIERKDFGDMRLGELADRVKPIYGEDTLKRFAIAIGIAPCTVKRHRDVYRAWASEIHAPGRELKELKYSVARELATHPDRAEIVRGNPSITKREAQKVMKQWRAGQANPTDRQRDAQNKNNERWWREVVKLANKAIEASRIADGKVAPELHAALRSFVDPALLPDLREGGQALIRIADFLENVAKPAPETQPRPSEDQPLQAAE